MTSYRYSDFEYREYNGHESPLTFFKELCDGEAPAFKRMGEQEQLTLFGKRSKRQIWKPNSAMYKIHGEAIRAMRFILCDPSCQPFSGSDANAQSVASKNNTFIYVVDLEDAFGAVNLERLAQLLSESTFRVPRVFGETVAETKEVLARYFMSPDGGLYQGGPASYHLFHFYVAKLLDDFFIPMKSQWVLDDSCLPTDIWRMSWKQADKCIRECPRKLVAKSSWSFRNGLTYCRYVDDLVFSSREPIGKRKRKTINRVIREAGFTVNESKTRGIVLRKQAVTLNSVGLQRTSNGVRTFLPREKARILEKLLLQALAGKPVDPAVIHGYMGLFKMATKAGNYNATEQRIVDLYKQFHPGPKVPKDIFGRDVELSDQDFSDYLFGPVF